MRSPRPTGPWSGWPIRSRSPARCWPTDSRRWWGSRRCSTWRAGGCRWRQGCCARAARPWRRSAPRWATNRRRRSRARSNASWGCRPAAGARGCGRPGVTRSPGSRSAALAGPPRSPGSAAARVRRGRRGVPRPAGRRGGDLAPLLTWGRLAIHRSVPGRHRPRGSPRRSLPRCHRIARRPPGRADIRAVLPPRRPCRGGHAGTAATGPGTCTHVGGPSGVTSAWPPRCRDSDVRVVTMTAAQCLPRAGCPAALPRPVRSVTRDMPPREQG